MTNEEMAGWYNEVGGHGKWDNDIGNVSEIRYPASRQIIIDYLQLIRRIINQ